MSKKISELVRNTNMYLLGVIIGARRFSVYFNSLRGEASSYLSYYKSKSPEQIAMEVSKVYLNGNFQQILEKQAISFQTDPEYGLPEFDYDTHYKTAVSFLSWIILAADEEIGDLEKRIRNEEIQIVRKEERMETVSRKDLQEINQRLLEYVKNTYLATN